MYPFVEFLPLQAEFILTIGVEGNPKSTEMYEETLNYFAQMGVTMVCANPDASVNRNGVLIIGPGALAPYHESQGGRVVYFGKPYRTICNICLEQLSGISPDCIVIVGDSLKTDIVARTTVESTVYFVGTGIHYQEFSAIPEDMRQLTALCRVGNTFPTMIAKGFVW